MIFEQLDATFMLATLLKSISILLATVAVVVIFFYICQNFKDD
jgi:hypothetical protein